MPSNGHEQTSDLLRIGTCPLPLRITDFQLQAVRVTVTNPVTLAKGSMQVIVMYKKNATDFMNVYFVSTGPEYDVATSDLKDEIGRGQRTNCTISERNGFCEDLHDIYSDGSSQGTSYNGVSNTRLFAIVDKSRLLQYAVAGSSGIRSLPAIVTALSDCNP